MSLILWATEIYWSDSRAVDYGQSLRFKAYSVSNAKIFLSKSYRKAEATETQLCDFQSPVKKADTFHQI